MDKKIGFIGGGNICKAIVGGLINASYTDPSNITVSDTYRQGLETLQAQWGVKVTGDNLAVASESDILVLSIKPQVYADVIAQIKNHVKPGAIVVSVAAGISLENMQNAFGAPQKIVRTMPNTPMLVGEGMTAVCPNSRVTEDETNQILAMFSCCGKAELLPEPLFHIESAVAGSSPAFVYMFIEAMADAAVADGLPRDKAYAFVSQAVLGAAKMVRDTKQHPGALKDMVCSPGGTTIEGVVELEKRGMRGVIASAIEKSTQKSKRMEEQNK